MAETEIIHPRRSMQRRVWHAKEGRGYGESIEIIRDEARNGQASKIIHPQGGGALRLTARRRRFAR